MLEKRTWKRHIPYPTLTTLFQEMYILILYKMILFQIYITSIYIFYLLSKFVKDMGKENLFNMKPLAFYVLSLSLSLIYLLSIIHLLAIKNFISK